MLLSRPDKTTQWDITRGLATSSEQNKHLASPGEAMAKGNGDLLKRLADMRDSVCSKLFSHDVLTVKGNDPQLT